MKYKSGLVRCLFNRARKICSDEFLAEELNFIKKILMKNGYSVEFINKCAQINKDIKFGPEKKKVFIELYCQLRPSIGS